MGPYPSRMSSISYRRHRFPLVVIQHAVWLYRHFTLSYRDVEELLAERGDVRRPPPRPRRRQREEVRFATDSPAEREGFEPSVPRERDGPRAIAKVVSRWALSELMYSLPQVWW